MSQTTGGVRAALSLPAIYSAYQNAIGARQFRQRVIAEYFRCEPGCRILDVGCGPADYLEDIEHVDYFGIDISPAYIAAAQRRFGGKGRFVVGGIEQVEGAAGQQFDIILASGLLHHLDDLSALRLFRSARPLLLPGGRVLTIDCCYVAQQSRFARFLIRNDRGQCVRTPDEYRAIALSAFPSVVAHVRHDLLRVPYTHCILECGLKTH